MNTIKLLLTLGLKFKVSKLQKLMREMSLFNDLEFTKEKSIMSNQLFDFKIQTNNGEKYIGELIYSNELNTDKKYNNIDYIKELNLNDSNLYVITTCTCDDSSKEIITYFVIDIAREKISVLTYMRIDSDNNTFVDYLELVESIDIRILKEEL